MKNIPKIRFTTRLPKPTLQKLKRESTASGKSVSDVIREALEKEKTDKNSTKSGDFDLVFETIKSELQTLKSRIELNERTVIKAVTHLSEQLNRLTEISSVSLSQQLDAIAFLTPIIHDTELQVSALFQAPEDSRVQSRLRSGYGNAREQRNQNYRKFNEELNALRRKYNVKN